MFAHKLQEDWPFAAVMIEALRKHKDLTPAAIQVFIEVYSAVSSPRTQTQLSRELGIGRKGVIGATRQLQDRGLIQYEGAKLRPVNLIKDL